MFRQRGIAWRRGEHNRCRNRPVQRRAAGRAAGSSARCVTGPGKRRGTRASGNARGRRRSRRDPHPAGQGGTGRRQAADRAARRVYPVTRPVEESVRLRDERVVIERRPVRGDAMSGNAGAPDLSAPRDVEIVERHEEPVASKRKTLPKRWSCARTSTSAPRRCATR
ncbi:MAG: DUF2382 domain-containing protein [Alphaproteobacteria bacterium]|nr:DUF2382 domain-containing protein [Alphaproteobacteria bacterium]